MDDDKITKALAAARLKEAKREDSDPDEVEALEHLIKLYNAEAAAKKAAKEAQAALDVATLKKYGDLDRGRRQDTRARRQVARHRRSRVASEVNSLTLDARRSHSGARRPVRAKHLERLTTR